MAIKNEQSRYTGNLRHTRHSTQTDNAKTKQQTNKTQHNKAREDLNITPPPNKKQKKRE